MLNNISPNRVLGYLLSVLVLIITLFLLEYKYYHLYFPTITLVVIGLVLVVFAFLIYRKLIINFQDNRKEIRNGVAQIEPLLFLHKKINTRKPLPRLRSYAASPDFLAAMIDIVQEHKPETIVEIGSGVSTLVNGYLLEQLGEGKVFSLDHEAEFGNKTTENIINHNLTEYAEVVIAPLKEYKLKGKSWKWYDLGVLLEKISTIDLLIIDGPPEKIQKNARYPAIPLLIEKLSPNAVILVDDCIRKEDLNTTQMWIKDYPYLSHQYIGLEKGMVVIRNTKGQ